MIIQINTEEGTARTGEETKEDRCRSQLNHKGKIIPETKGERPRVNRAPTQARLRKGQKTRSVVH